MKYPYCCSATEAWAVSAQCHAPCMSSSFQGLSELFMVWDRRAHIILGGNFRPVFQVLLEHQMGSGTEEEGENP